MNFPFNTIPSHILRSFVIESSPITVYNVNDYINYLINNNLIYDSKFINPVFPDIANLQARGSHLDKVIKSKVFQQPVRCGAVTTYNDHFEFVFSLNNYFTHDIISNIQIDFTIIYDLKLDKYIDTLLFFNNYKQIFKKFEYLNDHYFKKPALLNIDYNLSVIDIYGNGNCLSHTIPNSFCYLINCYCYFDFRLNIKKNSNTGQLLQFLLESYPDFHENYNLCVNYDSIDLSCSERIKLRSKSFSDDNDTILYHNNKLYLL